LDYRKIRKSQKGNSKILFKLLQVSVNIEDRLKLVFPNELREGLSPPESKKFPEGNTIAFARWLHQILFKYPGFLYDELHAATHLGFKTNCFKRLSAKFKDAKYSGVFAKTNQPLWWGSKLNDIIFSSPKAQKYASSNPWEIAPLVFNISKNDLSKCAVCGNNLPETVGFNLKDDSDLRPVHYKCSIPHPEKKRELYFDGPRAFEINKFIRKT
jgi:hypothetical protein